MGLQFSTGNKIFLTSSQSQVVANFVSPGFGLLTFTIIYKNWFYIVYTYSSHILSMPYFIFIVHVVSSSKKKKPFNFFPLIYAKVWTLKTWYHWYI